MKTAQNRKKEQRVRRHRKIRSRLSGTSDRPRLSVFKSNMYLYAQLIDDESAKTLFSMSTKNIKGKNDLERAETLGKELATKAMGKDIKKIVFDRGGFRYTGKVKALADGARNGGLTF